MFANNNYENESVDAITLPDGLNNLVKGYMEYVQEVIEDRAIVGIDGLKPSQRRILVTMKEIEKVKSYTKCATVVGSCMKLHPHGDSSIYETLCRMTDVSEILSIPLIKGKGKFKKVYSDEPSAAARYTECDFMPIAEEYFGDADGVEREPNYDNSRTEPKLLGVSFPSVLCNPTAGIAVGLASNIPAFNFHDVLKATINVIKTGRMGEEIAPDFAIGGEYVYDQAELKKIMKKGKGRLKLRGKWRIDNKTIFIDEIPYYTSLQRIKKVAEGIPGVMHCKDLSGLKGGKTVMQLTVECRDKMSVQSVLDALLKESDLQMTVTTNISVIIDGKPRVIGVEELLGEWVRFRTNVLKKKYTLQLQAVNNDISKYEVLVALLSDNALRERFINALVKSESMARGILHEAFPNIADNITDWILDMKIRSLSSIDKATKKLADYKAAKTVIEADLADIGGAIIRQLEELNRKYQFPRKTAITTTDYTFETVKPEARAVWIILKDKFISKYVDAGITMPGGIKCMSDDVLSIVTNNGKLLRIDLENISLTDTGSRGIYIPSYCEIPDDFDIVDCDIVENRRVGYVYADGFTSVLNLGEWVNAQRVTRVTANGMPEQSNLIVGKYDPENTKYLYMCTNTGRFCFLENDFKVKFRTARTRVIKPAKGEYIAKVRAVDLSDLVTILPNFAKYINTFAYLEKDEVFDSEAFAELVK